MNQINDFLFNLKNPVIISFFIYLIDRVMCVLITAILSDQSHSNLLFWIPVTSGELQTTY